LYVIPVLGGTPQLITNKAMPWGVGMSPDGKRIAFIYHPNGSDSSLNVAAADGSGERVIATGRGPDYFGFGNPPSWSPDGMLVGATSWWYRERYLTAIRAFPLDGGTPKLLLASTGFAGVGSWLPDQSGFLLFYNVKQSDPWQIWFRPYPHGDLQRITNDLKDYYDLTLNGDGNLLCAIARETFSTTFVGPSGNPERSQAVTTASKDGFALAWMPDGRLLLRNFNGEFSLMRADGTNRVPLFRDDREFLNYVSVCGNGRYIVFSSNREGKSFAIWRADSNTGALKRLTYGEGDMTPHCSSDGNWVVYHGTGSKTNMLQKVSIEGGAPSVLAKGEFAGARFSPDNKWIASYDCTNDVCKIRIFSSDGRSVKLFPLAPHGTLNYYDYSLLHWTPDGRALTYPLLDGDAMNLWRQPLSAGPPQQLTHFKELIFAYDWSPDGKRLAISRGSRPSDVVLISNFRQ
jgi:Tol biopolymer transport system component